MSDNENRTNSPDTNTNNNTDGPNKTSGQYHSIKGTVVESIGNLTGATSWKQSGREEHASGEAEITAAEAKGYASGLADRTQGRVENVAGALTGDRTQQTQGTLREEAGKAQMKVNEPVLSQ